MQHKQIRENLIHTIAKRKNHILVTLALLSLVTTSACIYAMENPKLTNADFIRLHVVANSDTYEDQTLKLQVRDTVLSLLAHKMTELGGKMDLAEQNVPPDTVRQAMRYIQSSFPEIKAEAEEIIRQNGYDYPVEVSLGPSWIPEKVYGSAIFPAGEYLALTINIGQAAGSNWWCVLFPPLCLIDTSPEANKPGDEATKIEVKFKTLEIIEGII